MTKKLISYDDVTHQLPAAVKAVLDTTVSNTRFAMAQITTQDLALGFTGYLNFSGCDLQSGGSPSWGASTGSLPLLMTKDPNGLLYPDGNGVYDVMSSLTLTTAVEDVGKSVRCNMVGSQGKAWLLGTVEPDGPTAGWIQFDATWVDYVWPGDMPGAAVATWVDTSKLSAPSTVSTVKHLIFQRP